MQKINRMAAEDAFNWARAEMFFGEGAGTRRKLLEAEIGHKIKSITGYQDLFNKSYDAQDFAEHAIKAAKERKKLDRAVVMHKNARAIYRGDSRNVSPLVAVVIVSAVVMHRTGYDKVLLRRAQDRFRQARLWYDYGPVTKD